MADDVTLNPGAAGDVVAADDIAGVKYQRVKVTFGADGAAADVDAVTTNSRLPTRASGYVAPGFANAHPPLTVGGEARTTLPAAVDNNDVVDFIADITGRQITMPFAPRERITHNRVVLNTTDETTLIASGAAATYQDLVSLDLSNEGGVKVRVDIRDSGSGTIRWSASLPSSGTGTPNVQKSFPAPLTQATAQRPWTAQLTGVSSNVYITAMVIDST